MVFLNFQRLPSLNAGIFSSYTYLYSVSGLTPEVLRGLANIHDFRRFGHTCQSPFHRSYGRLCGDCQRRSPASSQARFSGGSCLRMQREDAASTQDVSMKTSGFFRVLRLF